MCEGIQDVTNLIPLTVTVPHTYKCRQRILPLAEGFRCRGQLKYDGTHAETRFRLSAKRTSPFKSAGASVQSTTGSRGVPITGSYAGYTMLRGSVKGTGYPLHSPVSPSFPLRASPCAITFQLESTANLLPCGVFEQSDGMFRW